MKFIKYFAGILLVGVLAACGAGGGNPGSTLGTTSPSTGTTPVTTTTASIADYIFEIDKSTIRNSGSDNVVLTVTALDASRNIVSDVLVNVAVDAGGVFTPNLGNATNATGKYTGFIGIGGNKSNRTINARITVNGIVKVATVAVIGTKISVTPVPAVPQPGQTVTLNIKVEDAGGIGIAGTAVNLSGSLGASGAVVTDLSGNASVVVTAPLAGSYVAIASASGETFSLPISVVAPGGGSVVTIPNAVGPFSGAVLLPNPTTIAPNIAGSSLNRSVLTTKFIRSDNTTIANMRVRFQIMPDALGAGEFISTGDTIVYSGVDGIATADYVAGLRTSPTNGVKVRACFDYVDFPAGPASAPAGSPSCPNETVGSLTVNSRPLAISIGNFNKLETGLGGIAYVEKFLIQVADASGVAVQDAVVSMSVDITHFGKGTYPGNYYLTGGVPPTASSLNYPTPLDPNVTAPTFTFVSNLPGSSPTQTVTKVVVYAADNVPTPTYDPVTVTPISVPTRVWCVNEDRNRNGFNDVGEDVNQNSRLEPGKSEILLSYVNGNKTDANGQLLVQVSYPQNMGSWLAYTLKATTNVVGSEGTKERAFLTGVLEADVANGSFRTPPFGSGRCIGSN
jgi:hypothetical protein